MIDPHLAHVEAWLVAEPHLTAVEVLGRLAERAPGHFGSRQLRTVQRLVKAWRTKMAHLLIDGAGTMIMIDAPAAIPAGMAAGVSTTAAAARAG
jgi:hypothetical protein